MRKGIKKITFIFLLAILVLGNTSCMIIMPLVAGVEAVAGAAAAGVATLVGTGVGMGIDYAGDGDVASYDEVDTF